MRNEIEKKWFSKKITSTIAGVLLAILSGIVINLITGSFPSNNSLFYISIASIVLFVLCAIALLIILIIRSEIDKTLLGKTFDNEKATPDTKLSQNTLWEITLCDLYDKHKKKFKFWKWVGGFSFGLGVVAMIYVNFKIRTGNIEYEYRMIENTSLIVDSLDHLNRKFDQQHFLILQLTDSIQGIKNEIRISKDVTDEKEKTTNR